MHSLPFIDPQPPRLSEQLDGLRRIEASGRFTANGPELVAFEAEATGHFFGGEGACVALGNATLALMLALADATRGRARGGYAIMPAFTFAATAQAAWWAGLTPLLIDVDPADWCAGAAAEQAALHRYGEQVAAIVPCATFGHAIDLDRYTHLAACHDVAVVVDAAAALGTRDAEGRGFGAGAPFPIVYSMNVTKPFSVAEGALVHCADHDTIARLRAMAGFGFAGGRSAVMPGLNAKMPEAIALLARAKLATIDADIAARAAVAEAYRSRLDRRIATQAGAAGMRAHSFFPIQLPGGTDRARVAAALEAEGIGTGSYFSPHLGEQPWVREVSVIEATPVADDLAARVLALPVSERMTAADAERVVAALDRALATRRRVTRVRGKMQTVDTLMVGGGPAGTAVLLAASRHGALPALAGGLMLVEAGPRLGAGRLGGYAITSDSSADTFLSALAGNPHPEIAAVADHPAAHRVAAHRGGLGVPLTIVGPLLNAIGDRLGDLVRANGGTVATGTRVESAQRGVDGRWHATLRDGTGATRIVSARQLVLATGGDQSLESLVEQEVGGARLIDLADGRLVTSDAVLSVGGTAMVADLLRHRRAPRIAVVGGSTSALTSVVALLKGSLPLGAGAITLLHRRPLRPFYPSVDAAREEGFADFAAEDICPVSGFVYRLAGFRLEARELVLRQLGIDGRAPDPRVRLHRIAAGEDPAARCVLGEADLVIAALGYQPRALPLTDNGGRMLPLAGGDQPLVDRHCRVIDRAGAIVPDCYAIGLAAGFVPWGSLGGEPSFRGQANGLWLWQNDVGMMIVDQLLGRVSLREAA